MRFVTKSFLTLFLFAGSAVGQTSRVGGALEGTVSDSNGGRVPDATVQVRDTATQQHRQISTDAQGAFRISELPAAPYEVLVSQLGFTSYRHLGLTVTLGATVQLDITLQPSGVATR